MRCGKRKENALPVVACFEFAWLRLPPPKTAHYRFAQSNAVTLSMRYEF